MITLGTLSHVGKVREVNEDSFFVLTRPDTPQGVDAVLIVADGMGGREAGEVASSMAVEGVSSRIASEEDALKVEAPDTSLQWMFKEVNAAIYEASSAHDKRGMGTTLTMALLSGGTLSVAHVGDSRAYLFRDRELRQLTGDHSWVAEEVRRGALTPEQAKSDPRRSVLTRAIGVAPDVDVEEFEVEIREGDLLVLCSDGLHSQVMDDEIGEVLSSDAPQTACQILVDRANAMGGHDNVTVVIAMVNSIGANVQSPPQTNTQHERKAYDLDPPAMTAARQPADTGSPFKSFRSTLLRFLKNLAQG